MITKIINISGAQVLSKTAQTTILGGGVTYCRTDAECSFNCGKCNRRGICMFPTSGCA